MNPGQAVAREPAETTDQFFQVGGTLDLQRLSYVARNADFELYRGLRDGEPSYVLDTRQMGKSSMMARVGKRLRDEGAAVAFIDISGLGQSATIDQWYIGQLESLGSQFQLVDEINAFIDLHEKLGPVDLWSRAIREVIVERLPNRRIVIVLDEIDFVRSLPFPTDEYFAAIRHLVNSRAHDDALRRLTFCLIGVATPSDLIRGEEITPFNLGQRIELADFTKHDARPLTRGWRVDAEKAEHLLTRVLYWTDGHPFLTQSLCAAIGQNESRGGSATVDDLCRELFFVPAARDQNDNLRMVTRRLFAPGIEPDKILGRYQAIRNGDHLPYDAEDPLTSVLKLSGIAKVVNGHWVVRNRIYQQVFDDAWIREQLTPDEVLRQEQAARKARNRTLQMAVAIVVGAVGLVSLIFAFQLWQARQVERDLRLDQERQTKELQDKTAQLQKQTEELERTARLADEARLASEASARRATESQQLAQKNFDDAVAQRSRAERAAEDLRKAANAATASEREAILQAGLATAAEGSALRLRDEAEATAKQLASTNAVLVPLQLTTQASIARSGAPNLIDRAALLGVEALGRSVSLDAYIGLSDTLAMMPDPRPSDWLKDRVVGDFDLNPSGQFMVAATVAAGRTGGDQGQLCVLNLRIMKEMRCRNRLFETIFSVTDTTVLGVSDEGYIQTWNWTTNAVIKGDKLDSDRGYRTFLGPIASSPDGIWTVRVNLERQIFRLQQKGSTIKELPYGDGLGTPPVFSPKSTYLYIDSDDRPVWRLNGGREKLAPTSVSRRNETEMITAAAFSPDEQLFVQALSSTSSSVSVWSLTSDRLIATLPQTDRVSLVAFSPDSKYFAISQPTSDLVRIYARTGAEVARVHTTGVKFGTFVGSDEHLQLMTGSDAGVRFWDFQNWPARYPTGTTVGDYNVIGAGPSSSLLAVPVSNLDSRTLRVRSLSGNTPPRRVLYFARTADFIEVALDARYLAVVSGAATGPGLMDSVDIFDGNSGTLVNRASIARGSTIFGFGADNNLSIYQPYCTKGPNCLTVLEGRSGLVLFERSFGQRVWGRLSADRRVHAVTERGILYSFDLDGQETAPARSLATPVTGAAFNEAGTLAVVRGSSTFDLWNTSGFELRRIPKIEQSLLNQNARLELSPSGRYVAVVLTNQLTWFDAETGTAASGPVGRTEQLVFLERDNRLLRRAGDQWTSYSISTGRVAPQAAPPPRGTRAISRDGLWAVTVEGSIGPSAASPRPILSLAASRSAVPWQGSASVTAFAVDPGGERLALAGVGRIELADAKTRRVEPLGEPPLVPVQAMAFANEGTHVIAAAADELRLWDLSSTSKVLARLSESSDVSRIVTDTHGAHVGLVRTNGTIEVWRFNDLMIRLTRQSDTTSRPLTVIPNALTRVVSMSADGGLLAGAIVTEAAGTAPGRMVRIWNAASGAVVKDLVHDADVLMVAFNPSGTHLVSITPTAARIWQTSTWKEVGQLHISARPTSVAFSADGTRIGITSSDGTLYVTPWQRRDVIAEACSRLDRKRLDDTEVRQFFFEGATPNNYCEGSNIYRVSPE